MLSAAAKEPLLRHIQLVNRQHEGDLRLGLGRVALPYALEIGSLFYCRYIGTILVYLCDQTGFLGLT
jgi:hypothetical protein